MAWHARAGPAAAAAVDHQPAVPVGHGVEGGADDGQDRKRSSRSSLSNASSRTTPQRVVCQSQKEAPLVTAASMRAFSCARRHSDAGTSPSKTSMVSHSGTASR